MEEYRVLEMDVIRFEAEDIIITSPNELPEIPTS